MSARELLRTMISMDCSHLVSLPEDGTEGQSAGLCAIEALEALEQLEADGWRFLPPGETFPAGESRETSPQSREDGSASGHHPSGSRADARREGT